VAAIKILAISADPQKSFRERYKTLCEKNAIFQHSGSVLVLDYHSIAEYRYIVHFAEIFYLVAMEPFFRVIWRDLVGE
jgi:hypothetical protein